MDTAAAHATGVMRLVLHFRLFSEDEKAHWNWTRTHPEAETEEGSPQLVMCDSFQERANIGATIHGWSVVRTLTGRGSSWTAQGWQGEGEGGGEDEGEAGQAGVGRR